MSKKYRLLPFGSKESLPTFHRNVRGGFESICTRGCGIFSKCLFPPQREGFPRTWSCTKRPAENSWAQSASEQSAPIFKIAERLHFKVQKFLPLCTPAAIAFKFCLQKAKTLESPREVTAIQFTFSILALSLPFISMKLNCFRKMGQL